MYVVTHFYGCTTARKRTQLQYYASLEIMLLQDLTHHQMRRHVFMHIACLQNMFHTYLFCIYLFNSYVRTTEVYFSQCVFKLEFHIAIYSRKVILETCKLNHEYNWEIPHQNHITFTTTSATPGTIMFLKNRIIKGKYTVSRFANP